jgi:ATP-dependent Lhr-like helicase
LAGTFAGLPARLQEAIVSRLGWASLRPVQELAGTAILAGKNAVVLAPTAGGKTEAAVFPVLAQLMEKPTESVGALYVAPIKALLNNQEERLDTYTGMVGLRRFVWHGDATPAARRAFAREPAELLMTTPESLEVMLLSSWVPVARLFRDLRVVIIDEVHALAGTDRGAHLMSVLERLARFTTNDVQRIGLSATVGNPDEILVWLAGTSKRDGTVIDPPKEPSKRAISVLLRENVASIAHEAGIAGRGKKSLFFCRSRALTESVAERMQGQGIDVFVHHSSVSLEERRAAEERFHRGKDACIVCTSTLELGIDVGDLDLVFQAGAPSTVSSFMQRMGRTGRRAGQVANTTFLCEEVGDLLQAIALVELARERWIEPVPPQSRCWPVLVHQILAMTLQFGGVPADMAWDQLGRVPDFSGISRREFDELLAHLTAEGYLFLADGRYSMGEKGEKVFGRKNFMELYAVFSSPVLFRVQTAGRREIGSLEQDFVDQLVEEMSSFLLGGRAWTVEQISHSERIVRVREAPRGKKPKWGGFIPQILGYELCRKVMQVLCGADEYPYLDEMGSRALAEQREDLGELLRRRGNSIRVDDDGAHWWTFAGGRINHTMKYALGWIGDWKVVADNFQLRVEGNGVGHLPVEDAIRRMTAPGFWDDPETHHAIIARLPEYRLSKFQRALPDAASAEMVGRYLLDTHATAAWLKGREEAGR